MSEKPQGSKTDQPTAPGRRNQADAIEPSGDVNREKLRQNQLRLHVGADHRTESMKKGRRGTYP